METVHGTILSERDWVLRHVDQRCRSCGMTSAGSSFCYSCGSLDVEYRTHQETPEGETFWCGRGRNTTRGS